MAIDVEVNGKSFSIDADPNTPLLWIIREELKLTGTKFGCGIGMCGACSVHLDGEITRSCRIPVAAVAGRRITTIEGIAAQNGALICRCGTYPRMRRAILAATGQAAAAQGNS